MFGNDIFTRVKRSENKKMAEIAQFLHENDLSVDTTVEVFITVTRDEKLIACGGIAGNIIKCVAISESVRGEGLALTLATELINLAYERHSTHLFIYTKTEYEALFRQCGFSTLTSVPGVMVLMENSATRLKRYAESRHWHQAQTTCCGGCEFYVVAAKRKSLAILPWQSRDTAGACQQGFQSCT